MENILVATNLEKVYGGKTKALDGVSLSVEGGSVFALLGPNGAGKTTFVRIIATQLLPTKGTATIHGYDVVSNPKEVRKRIAVVPQEARPFSLQTPHEHVLTYLVTRGVDLEEAKRRTDSTLRSLNLHEYRNIICSNLSGGLRQRVLIAMAMSTDAELLVLDEPTIGLDPIARVEVWNLLRDYVARSGRTILLTTHYMDEAEVLSDRLAIVNKGKFIAIGTPKEIRSRVDATHVAIVKSKLSDVSEFQSFGRVLRAGASVRILTTQAGAKELTDICLKKNLEVSVRQVDLEDVFISEVGIGLENES